MTKKKIGICCTGNTCRSPVTAIWLNHFAIEKNIDVEIWTAGTHVKEADIVNRKGVEEEAINSAIIMGLDKELVDKLKKHVVSDIWSNTNEADLLIWITNIKNKKHEITKTLMTDLTNKLGCGLKIINEKDKAWKAKKEYLKNDGSSPEKYKSAYLKQGERLKQWSEKIINELY